MQVEGFRGQLETHLRLQTLISIKDTRGNSAESGTDRLHEEARSAGREALSPATEDRERQVNLNYRDTEPHLKTKGRMCRGVPGWLDP